MYIYLFSSSSFLNLKLENRKMRTEFAWHATNDSFNILNDPWNAVKMLLIFRSSETDTISSLNSKNQIKNIYQSTQR